MPNVQCKMCGGCLSLPEGTTSSTCEYCGSMVTFPKITSNDMESLYNRAEHFRNIHEYDKAIDAYEKIVEGSPDDADAYWGLVLCRYGIEYVEDPSSHERIPTCHRVQYDSILADPDYLAALEHAGSYEKEMYTAEAEKIADIQRGILAASNQEDPYDIFICYKESDESGKRTRDSVVAQDIYYKLTDAGFNVFFARISLESKLGAQYEPCIFAALNSAKVMLVIGSKKEYFEAVWVKNEWSRFLSILKKDRSKVLIPCYNNMDAYDIPKELSMFQAQDMGKIGFDQDLLHGIRKIIKKKQEAAPAPGAATVAVAPTVVTVAAAPVETESVESMLTAVKYMLIQHKFSDARKKCKVIIAKNPDNCWGYWYSLLAEYMVVDIENVDIRKFRLDKTYELVKKIADNELRAQIDKIEKSLQNKQHEVAQAIEILQQKCDACDQFIKSADSRIDLLERHFYLERALNGENALTEKLEEALDKERSAVKSLGRIWREVSSLVATVQKGKEISGFNKSVYDKFMEENGLSDDYLKQMQMMHTQLLSSCGSLETKEQLLQQVNFRKRQRRIRIMICAVALISVCVIVGSIVIYSVMKHVKNQQILADNFLKVDSAGDVLTECEFRDSTNRNRTILIPETISHISGKAFNKTAPFDRLVVSKSVKKIDDGTFNNCYIGKIEFEKGSSFYFDEAKRTVVSKKSGRTISALPVLAADNKHIIKADGECIIPLGTIKIEPGAFKNFKVLKRVVIPQGVVTIGKQAFYGCVNLEEVVMPGDIDIAVDAFIGCVKYHRIKADEGNAQAQYHMGNYYFQGYEVEQDFVEAVRWYTMAVEQGDIEAQFALGNCYFVGTGVDKDVAKATNLWEKAAEKGHVHANLALGKYYMTKDESGSRSFRYFSTAASLENAEAIHYLGLCYANGYGIAQSYKDAILHYEKAANMGVAAAMRELGKCYVYGKGVTKNFDTAAIWLEKAAVGGDTEGQYFYGWYLEATSDIPKARYWLQKAADKGYEKAKKRLDSMK